MNPTKSLTPSVNGRKQRPQLADSINRLDAMLDGLAEAIPATVADSIRAALADAVKEAVQAALTELLSDPAVLATLMGRLPALDAIPVVESPTPQTTQPQQPQQGKAKRSWLGWLRAGCDRLVSWTSQRADALERWCSQVFWPRVSAAAGVVWKGRGPLGIGLATGVGVGLLAYLLGPLMASILCGLAVATFTTAGILVAPVLRLLATLGRGAD